MRLFIRRLRFLSLFSYISKLQIFCKLKHVYTMMVQNEYGIERILRLTNFDKLETLFGPSGFFSKRSFSKRNVQLKKQHYTNRIAACKGNMKESWKTINELLNKRSKSSSIDCLKESGTETRNKKDVSNAMNNFFCTIGRELADKIQPAINPLLSGWAGRPLKSSLAMSLKQWSSSRSMTWLHNTCVTSSQKTQHAPPATSGTLVSL